MYTEKKRFILLQNRSLLKNLVSVYKPNQIPSLPNYAICRDEYKTA